tara:strand:+ start:203 stop:439 length:237 start_codon:yes stop_codon:yes gene_type:complete
MIETHDKHLRTKIEGTDIVVSSIHYTLDGGLTFSETAVFSKLHGLAEVVGKYKDHDTIVRLAKNPLNSIHKNMLGNEK